MISFTIGGDPDFPPVMAFVSSIFMDTSDTYITRGGRRLSSSQGAPKKPYGLWAISGSSTKSPGLGAVEDLGHLSSKLWGWVDVSHRCQEDSLETSPRTWESWDLAELAETPDTVMTDIGMENHGKSRGSMETSTIDGDLPYSYVDIIQRVCFVCGFLVVFMMFHGCFMVVFPP